MGLHQGSALSPLLFIVIIDVLSEHLRAENLWELLFADDLVIMADSEEQLQERLVKWQKESGTVWAENECQEDGNNGVLQEGWSKGGCPGKKRRTEPGRKLQIPWVSDL